MSDQTPLSPQDVPIFILAGGLGTRFREQTHLIPKPMIELDGKPILWHIMNKYSRHGFRNFVVCAGYKAEVIKDYFLNYRAINSDFTVDMKEDSVTFHSRHDEDWSVTVVDTGADSMTGYRIHNATKRFLGDSKTFGVTYGDGLTDADLGRELQFHLDKGKIGTVLGIHPPARFGEIRAEEGVVQVFAEKKPLETSWISGGFFFFEAAFTKFVSDDPQLVLEEKPLENLVSQKELAIFEHDGFWACMDTQRDHDTLEKMVRNQSAPWLI